MAVMVPTVQQSCLVVTVVKVLTGMTLDVIPERQLERRAVTVVMLVTVELWVTAVTAVTVVAVLMDPLRV
jgi:hypothetical protein